MSFDTILRAILEESGGIGVALMGTDGVPVAQLQSQSQNQNPTGGAGAGLSEDVGIAGAEFVRILEEIRKVADALGGGEVTETVISLSHFSLIFRAIDEDLFVVLAMPVDGNLGKARYLIRRHQLAIRQEL